MPLYNVVLDTSVDQYHDTECNPDIIVGSSNNHLVWLSESPSSCFTDTEKTYNDVLNFQKIDSTTIANAKAKKESPKMILSKMIILDGRAKKLVKDYKYEKDPDKKEKIKQRVKKIEEQIKQLRKQKDIMEKQQQRVSRMKQKILSKIERLPVRKMKRKSKK